MTSLIKSRPRVQQLPMSDIVVKLPRRDRPLLFVLSVPLQVYNDCIRRSDHSPIHLSIYLAFLVSICQSFCTFFCLFIYLPFFAFIHQCTSAFIHLSVLPFIYVSPSYICLIHHSSILLHLSICLCLFSIYPSTHLSLRLSVLFSIQPFIYLPFCPFFFTHPFSGSTRPSVHPFFYLFHPSSILPIHSFVLPTLYPSIPPPLYRSIHPHASIFFLYLLPICFHWSVHLFCLSVHPSIHIAFYFKECCHEILDRLFIQHEHRPRRRMRGGEASHGHRAGGPIGSFIMFNLCS